MSGKAHHDCPNAGNPYHECNARCFERINSGNVLKKEKKPFGFGKLAWRKESSPISPARVIAGNRSPLPSFYAKRMVESAESPSFSSSDDTFNANLFRPRSPIHGANKAELLINWLPMSPSLAEYCKKDSFASKFDHREGEASIHYGVDTEMSPKTKPKTPKHPLRTLQHRPQTPDSRPRTPEQRSSTTHNSTALETRPITPEYRSNITDSGPRTPEYAYVALGPRPRTPDTRPRTVERRARSPEYWERSSMQRSKTPEPQGKYLEPRIPQTQPILHSAGLKSPRKVDSRRETPETPERARPPDHRARNPIPGSRIPQTQTTSFVIGDNYGFAAQRTPQATKYHGNKTSSVYTEECILLYPELLLSPQENPSSRPITPSRKGYESPKKHQDFDQPDESESIDNNNFLFLDDHDDGSVYLYPDTTTPPNYRSRSSLPKPSNELSDECKSFTLSEFERICETGEETQSMMSESYVSVGSYKVRASVSDTLQQILDKHGDIASGSKLESLPTRSYSLETLGSVVLELQSTPLKQLKETRVLEMLAVVKDVESVKIRAGWLREVLIEILEAVRCYDRHKTSVVEKEICERDAWLGRQEMEKIMEEVRLKEKEVKNFRQGFTEMAGRLGELEIKRARLEKSLWFLRSKVDKFDGESVLENVF